MTFAVFLSSKISEDGPRNLEPWKLMRITPEFTTYSTNFHITPVASVTEWYRYRTVACLVTSSSPVPLKTRRVGQRCTLNLSRADASSRWRVLDIRSRWPAVAVGSVSIQTICNRLHDVQLHARVPANGVLLTA
ncbi:hypothetical protein TNCV_3715801 [Trichonephila clavipes]|nr:hypothetical protein TNCV_3715801 [Trichonephila clavipes]